MHHRYIIIIFITIMCFNAADCMAQKTFAEGTLVYNVVMDAPANADGPKQYSGTYIITIKGSQVKKELKLQNGFETTLVTDYANKQAYTLKKMGEQDVAIQIDMAQLEGRKKKYEHFTLKYLNKPKQVAETNADEAIIKYENGDTFNFFCTKDWLLSTDVFEHFPGIKELPVLFAYSSDEGLVTHFDLQKITAMPVENAAFKIPSHARVISSEEYKELKGKQ